MMFVSSRLVWCNKVQRRLFTNSTSPLIEKRIRVTVGAIQDVEISVISLNDPKSKNALSKSSVFGMLEILQRLRSEIDESTSHRIRALVVRSSVPGVFCAGANLKERQAMSRGQVISWLRVQRSLMDNLSHFPYPTIAAIDGHALGGGLELALACDIRVVNERAKVGLVETKLAIIPGAGGTQRLPRLIGVERAKELIFAAEPVDGSEAHRIGIASHLASGEEGAFRKALDIAERFCPQAPGANPLAKAAIDMGGQVSLDTGLDIENAHYRQLLDSKDRAEGMRAFIEKRPPIYTGE